MVPTTWVWERGHVLLAEAMTHEVTRPGGLEPPASSSAGKRSIHLSYGRSLTLAERLGFEPRVDLSGLHTLSRRAPSTARPPLLNVGPYRQARTASCATRRARDSNPHEPRGPVDFKSTALPVRTSPPSLLISSTYKNRLSTALAGVVKTVETVIQLLYGGLFIAMREMVKSPCHTDILMPPQLVDDRKVDTRPDQPPCKGALQPVKRKALDACRTNRTFKGVGKGATGRPRTTTKDPLPGSTVYISRLQQRGQGVVHRHAARFRVVTHFRLAGGDPTMAALCLSVAVAGV